MAKNQSIDEPRNDKPKNFKLKKEGNSKWPQSKCV